jgi:S1-C subfamily serine protease
VHVDAKGKMTLDVWDTSIAEGTPVVNADGLLVGMCSHNSAGPMLVNVANLASLMQSKPQPGAWLGIHIVDSAAGPVIDAINPDGPAGRAGIAAGDVVTALDGLTIATIDDLKNAVAGYAPGDTVTVTVLHADQSVADVSVTFGTAPSI